jgi:hypothetical protein
VSKNTNIVCIKIEGKHTMWNDLKGILQGGGVEGTPIHLTIVFD